MWSKITEIITNDNMISMAIFAININPHSLCLCVWVYIYDLRLSNHVVICIETINTYTSAAQSHVGWGRDGWKNSTYFGPVLFEIFGKIRAVPLCPLPIGTPTREHEPRESLQGNQKWFRVVYPWAHNNGKTGVVLSPRITFIKLEENYQLDSLLQILNVTPQRLFSFFNFNVHCVIL